jgi:hypothetical protein
MKRVLKRDPSSFNAKKKLPMGWGAHTNQL